MKKIIAIVLSAGSFGLTWAGTAWAAEDFPKPYSPPCVERESVFEFTEKPKVKNLGNDKYEITFAVKGNCDVTVGIVDAAPSTTSTNSGQAGSRLREDATAGTAGQAGVVVRHLGAGVLGANAPAPFQKNSLKQTIYWNGKDDLDVYHKTPEKLKVRVMLGLKPEFDKRLGVTNPRSIPGRLAWGIGCDETGVYVVAGNKYTRGDRMRKFDHDGNYLGTLNPPPANMPPERLQGMGFVEYEPGRKEWHKSDFSSVSDEHNFFPSSHSLVVFCQFAIIGSRIYYCTKVAPYNRAPAMLHYINTDGSMDLKGAVGRPFLKYSVPGQPFSPGAPDRVFMAASPDGKWLYWTGQGTSVDALFRHSLESEKLEEMFVGAVGKPGSDNGHFQRPLGLDCDDQGRIYVCDFGNNRIQVFTPDGKHAKTIPLDRPAQIKVHRKTSALYVSHKTRVQGATVDRISKLMSYDNPTVELYRDGAAGLMALDSWTAKPRIWLFGDGNLDSDFGVGGTAIRIWEEAGKEFRPFADFEEEVKKEAGARYSGPWSGLSRASGGKMVCDPVREQVYYANSRMFDLRTGAFLGSVRVIADDIAFDKRGYMHCHFNPSGQQGVGRLDPSRPGNGPKYTDYLECPYDYGVEGKDGWLGILPVRDQLGAKFFQDGVGVDMRGDVVVQSNIYYAPKRDDQAFSFALAGNAAMTAKGEYQGSGDEVGYQNFVADIQKKLKLGEEVYWIRPRPGVPLIGATVWTFDRNGELRDECAVTAGGLINGVQMDEDGAVYFVCDRTRLINGKPFLGGRGGVFGAGKDEKVVMNPLTSALGRQPEPFTGTLVKVRPKASILSTGSPIPLEESRPERPPDFAGGAWLECAEWLYAGASPIVNSGCSCPTMRFHTDWYKRTFVPEQYRHSIGVLDTAGNLILHIGQYGNFDSGYGKESKIPIGGDGIAFSDARMVSGTDNYLCFSDRGERIIVVKLNYHAEETVGIQ